MHEIQAIIGRKQSIDQLKSLWPSMRVRELIQDFSIVPVDAELAAEIVGTEFTFPDIEDEDRNKIADDLKPLTQALRVASPAHFALICTQYFGGLGEQLAVLFGDGDCKGPFLGFGSINLVLQSLGIYPDGQRDCFDVAGLHRWRSVDDLMKALEKAFGYKGNNMNLPVPNLDAALPFYEKVLGFRVISRSDTPHKSAVLGRDAVQIGLAENGGDPTQDGCAFHVTGLEALFEEFQINGLGKQLSDFDTEQRGDVAWQVFYVVAPDGLCYWFGERQTS